MRRPQKDARPIVDIVGGERRQLDGLQGDFTWTSEGVRVVTIHHDTSDVNDVEYQKTRPLRPAQTDTGSRPVFPVRNMPECSSQTQRTQGVLGGVLAVQAPKTWQGPRDRRDVRKHTTSDSVVGV